MQEIQRNRKKSTSHDTFPGAFLHHISSCCQTGTETEAADKSSTSTGHPWSYFANRGSSHPPWPFP
jgi:hypothetical protein